MATPTRTSILLDIKSTLEAITTTNGYKTTVDTVEPYLRGRDDVKTGERPYLGFGFETESYEHQMYQNMRVPVRWYVTGCITSSSSWANTSAGLNNLVDDVITAVMADPTLGGYATDTKLIATDTDESDPDVLLGGGAAWVFLEFETVYYRETTAS